ncbi:hypothetical protein C2S51_003433 [Perilla frutescens var. frutescens]|nr:hypothetical protein C2S51_003433 [Perilla frutescens var. frutescens]
MQRGGASGGGAGRSAGSSSSSVGLSSPVGDMTLEGSSSPEVDTEGRRRCWVQDDQLMSAHQVASAITCNFKKFLYPTGFTWKMVPAQRRQHYMEEFRDAAVWAAWSLKAADRYKDMVRGFKRNRTKGYPPFMPPEMWEGFKAHWDSDAFKKKSEISSKNSLSEPDGPGTSIVKHRGGSRSAVAHAAALAKEKGVESNNVAWETSKRLHDTADGSYSDGKSRRIATDVLARVEELSQPTSGIDEPPHVDMSVVYVDTAHQHSKKNRIFWLDSRSWSLSAPSVSSSAPPQPDTQAAIKKLQEKMDA